MERWHDLIYAGPMIHDQRAYAAYMDGELAARRAVVAAANDKQIVPIVKAVRVCAQCSRPVWDRPGSVSDACVCGERLTVLVSVTTSTGGEPVYIAAGPPAPGPVSVPSVFGTSPLTSHQATCPTCGALLPGGVPAQDANIANEPPPSGYMSKPKML